MRMPSPARRNFLALVRFSAEITDPYMLGSALSEKPDVDVKRVGQQQHFVMASLTLLYVDSEGGADLPRPSTGRVASTLQLQPNRRKPGALDAANARCHSRDTFFQ
jgi:hypothetical protein